jgi:hypothetical protein
MAVGKSPPGAEARSFKASNKGIPPPVCGSGSLISADAAEEASAIIHARDNNSENLLIIVLLLS